MNFLMSIGSMFLFLFMFQCKEKMAHDTNNNLDTIFPKIVKSVFLDSVWAANKVSFDLHTIGSKQYVAYYDKNRMMTVAVRDTSSTHWDKKILPNRLAWDSHNYVVLGFDEVGYIHVSGNMHGDPLVYFKSEKPYDIDSIIEINSMVGNNEDKVTYPNFLNDNDKNLYYLYRTGGSGSGNNWVNKYNTKDEKWERYLKTNLFEGIGKNETRSAYYSLTKGSDGYFHCTWVWRWSPLVETTHQLCYAISPDLLHWKNFVGETIELPFKPDNDKLIVDNAPTQGGMHNGKYKLFLTKENKPVIGYLKYDNEGLTQLFMANVQRGKWVTKKISDWQFRWMFVGGGDQMSDGANFTMEADNRDENLIIIKWTNETGMNGTYAVNLETLEKLEKFIEIKDRYPANLNDRISDDSRLHVNIRIGKNDNKDSKIQYVLKWESMGKSHGNHAPAVIPNKPLSTLNLIEIK